VASLGQHGERYFDAVGAVSPCAGVGCEVRGLAGGTVGESLV
jgi:hypothetical protein